MLTPAESGYPKSALKISSRASSEPHAHAASATYFFPAPSTAPRGPAMVPAPNSRPQPPFSVAAAARTPSAVDSARFFPSPGAVRPGLSQKQDQTDDGDKKREIEADGG